MLTLDSIDASTPASKICLSVNFGLKILEHARATADEIALELFSPYPVGISESRVTSILFSSSSFFVRIFSIVLLINLELRLLFSDMMLIPFPGLVSIVASTFNSMPNVAPFLVAIAFTSDIAPCTVAFAFAITLLLAMLFSWHYKVLPSHAISQMLWLLDQVTSHNRKLQLLLFLLLFLENLYLLACIQYRIQLFLS